MDKPKTEFVEGLYAKKSDKDFVVVNLNIKVEAFSQWLISKKDFIEKNNGWMSVGILKAKDPDKVYASFKEYVSDPQYSNNQHSPDREVKSLVPEKEEEAEDLPF